MKYRKGNRVVFTDMAGERWSARVIDASRDHVTIRVDASGREVRFEDADVIAMHLSKNSGGRR